MAIATRWRRTRIKQKRDEQANDGGGSEFTVSLNQYRATETLRADDANTP